MKIRSIELIEQLQADTRQLILVTGYLKAESTAILSEQPGPNKWSVAQVLEHLNSYGRYYLPEIEKSLTGAAPAKEWFKAGWIGNYFTKLMQPGKEGRVTNKMKAPKDHRPSPALDVQSVIDTFLDQQQQLLKLLELAKAKDIGRARTPISISRFIKLKTGDTFRFLVAHEQRHFVQISNVLNQVKGNEGQHIYSPGDAVRLKTI